MGYNLFNRFESLDRRSPVKKILTLYLFYLSGGIGFDGCGKQTLLSKRERKGRCFYDLDLGVMRWDYDGADGYG